MPHQHSFEELSELGYHDRLLPIIPPGAPISPGSRIDDSQRGKIPGRPNRVGTWAGFDWLTYAPDPSDFESGAGVGLRCGGELGLVAVDIDVLNNWVAGQVQMVAERILGRAPWRIGQWPKRLLVYRVADSALTWRKYHLGDLGLVELRGEGTQCVVAGEHPVTNEPYIWAKPLPAVDDLPRITEDELNAFVEELDGLCDLLGEELATGADGGAVGHNREAVPQDALLADDPAELERAVVDYLPNESDDREDYVRVGCAIKAAGLSEDVFQRWAAKWPGNERNPDGNEPEVVSRDWSRMHPPFEVGAHWLYEQARAGGYGSEGAAAVFGEPAVADDPGRRQPRWLADYVWVEYLERFVCLSERSMMRASQYNNRWVGSVGETLQGEKSPSAVYLHHPKRQLVQDVTYVPGGSVFVEQHGQRLVNLWRPGPAHDSEHAWVEGDTVTDDQVQPWLELAEALIPDERERRLLLDWMAYQVQRPGRKCNWHPLIWGDQGIGKDTLFVPLLRGLGTNAVTVPANKLTGDFTAWLNCRSLVVIEEINTFERRGVADRLKPLLSCPPEEVEINRKFMPEYQLPNVVNTVLLSNHEDAMVLEQSDRRMFVLRSPLSKGVELDEDFFDLFYAWLGSQGAERVCRWLAQRELSADFRPQGYAPETGAKAAMQTLSMGQIESDVLEAIEDEAEIFQRDLVSSEEVRQWIRRRHGDRAAHQYAGRRVSRVMKKAGATYAGRGKAEGRQQRLWAVRRAPTYLQIADEGGLSREYKRQVNKLAATEAAAAFEDGG